MFFFFSFNNRRCNIFLISLHFVWKKVGEKDIPPTNLDFLFISSMKEDFFFSQPPLYINTHTHTRIIHVSPQRDYHVARKKETGREGDRAEVAFKLSGQD